MTNLPAKLWILAVVLEGAVGGRMEEPECYSRFDYDEKLLHKLVKLEHKMDELRDNLEGFGTELNEQAKAQKDIETKIQELNGVLDTRLKPNVGFHIMGVHNSSPKTGETLIFTKVKTNTGSAYDRNTGVFTAPTGGMYLLATQICNYGERGLQFHIYVNDEIMTNALQYTLKSESVCSTSSAVAKLQVGDRVFVKTGYKHGNADQVIFENVHRECMFSGVLVN